MSQYRVEKLLRKAVKSLMDIFILVELKDGSLSGNDIIGLVHKRSGISVSSGTVYSLLHSMERDDLIKGVQNGRRRVYKLTEKGEQNIKIITKANGEILGFFRNMWSFS